MHKNLNLYGLCKVETEDIIAMKVKLYYTNSIKAVLVEKGDYINVAYLEKDAIKTVYGKVIRIMNSEPKTIIIDYSSDCEGHKVAIRVNNIRDLENISDSSKCEYLHMDDYNSSKPDLCHSLYHPHPKDLGFYPSMDTRSNSNNSCHCDCNREDDDLAD